MLLLLKDEVLKYIIRELPAHDKNVKAIILFGSVVRRDFRPDSDIDLLILTDNPKETRKIFSELRIEFLEKGIVVSALYVTPQQYEESIDPLFKTTKKREDNIMEEIKLTVIQLMKRAHDKLESTKILLKKEDLMMLSAERIILHFALLGLYCYF